MKFFWKPKKNIGLECQQTGLLPDPVDDRDYLYASIYSGSTHSSIDWSAMVGAVKSQGLASACTGFSVQTNYELLCKIKGLNFWDSSERYNYYWSRQIGSLFPQDTGAYLRDAMKTAVNRGCCPESLCPYDVGKINETPNVFAESFTSLSFPSIKNKLRLYSRVTSIDNIKYNLEKGYPVSIGIPLYADFFIKVGSDTLKVPAVGEKEKGRHAVLLVGYDDNRKAFNLLNSWGRGYRQSGFVWLPYEYLEKTNWDAWVFRE